MLGGASFFVLTEVHGEAGQSFPLAELLSQAHLQQVGNERLQVKPCSPRYLLVDDCISSPWYMAPVRLSFSMTSSCFICSFGNLTSSRVLSTIRVPQHVGLCFQLQPFSPPHLCGQQPHSVLTCASTHHTPTSVTVSHCTSTLKDGDPAWNAQLHFHHLLNSCEINKLPLNLIRSCSHLMLVCQKDFGFPVGDGISSITIK